MKCKGGTDFSNYLDILADEDGGDLPFLKNVRTVDVVFAGTILAAGLTQAPVQLTLAAGDRTRPLGPLTPDGTMNQASKGIVTGCAAIIDYTATATVLELVDLMRLFGSASFEFFQDNNPLLSGLLGAYASSQQTRQGDGQAAPTSLTPGGPVEVIPLDGKPIIPPGSVVTGNVAGDAPAVAADHILAVMLRMVVGDRGED